MQKLNTSTSIVDYLKSLNKDSSMDSRKKLAEEYGISGNAGSAEWNTSLLKAMQGSSPSAYSGEVTSQMKDEFGSTEPEKETDEYGIGKLRTDIDSYKTKMDESFQKLKQLQTQTFNDEYDKRNLESKKVGIKKIDDEIATLKNARDEDILKVRQNPNLSASQMSGDMKKLADFHNARINNLIEQRNSVAGEYNTELSEIDGIVGRAVKDAESEYGYYAGLLDQASGGLTSYQKALSDEMKDAQKQSNWERELAQALQIAQMRASDSGSGLQRLQLVTDKFSGLPSGVFNPYTGLYEPYEEDKGTAGTQSIEDRLRNRFSTSELEKMAKEAGYKTGGFLGMGKRGDVTAYINAIKSGLVSSPI